MEKQLQIKTNDQILTMIHTVDKVCIDWVIGTQYWRIHGQELVTVSNYAKIRQKMLSVIFINRNLN
jgi:hypothetical protein